MSVAWGTKLWPLPTCQELAGLDSGAVCLFGGARLRQALISIHERLGLDGVSPHPGTWSLGPPNGTIRTGSEKFGFCLTKALARLVQTRIRTTPWLGIFLRK